jgi:hypothetical protein
MGADLYQVGKTYPDGYFRDSYNEGCVMWQLGLSWWRDVTPMLNEKRVLTQSKIRELLAMVESCRIPDEPKGTDGREMGRREYFVQSRQGLIDYLKEALLESRDIEASL